MKSTQIIIALSLLLSVQFSNVSAQVRDVEKLFLEQKYPEVLKVIDPLMEGYGGTPVILSALYYMRATSRFNVIYKSRTGVVIDPIFDINAEVDIRVDRARFEFEANDTYLKYIDGAISDANQSIKFGKEFNESEGRIEMERILDRFYWFDSTREREIREIEALSYLEKAQFITNKSADFSSAKIIFSGLVDDDDTSVKKNEITTAEMRYMVALGEIDDALALFVTATKADKSVVNSIPAMVEAFDLVGNYKYTEGFLLREAIRQISADKGQIVPANFYLLQNAMKLHLYNLNYAIGISPTNKLLPLQRSRLVSAYNVKGNLTPAETAFVKNAPDVIKAENETPPLDVQLISVNLKLQSTDKKEIDAARKTIEELLIKDATNAAILAVRGYSKMLSNDFNGAETDLSAAIIKDPFLAFANKAFENRALVYTKLGKADLAAKDQKENAQFMQVLGFLSAN